MARKTIRLDHKGMKELLRDPGVRNDLRKRAIRVRKAAEATAPHGETGDYARSFRVRDDLTDRAVVRVVNLTPYSHTVEASDHVLSSALDAAGDVMP